MKRRVALASALLLGLALLFVPTMMANALSAAVPGAKPSPTCHGNGVKACTPTTTTTTTTSSSSSSTTTEPPGSWSCVQVGDVDCGPYAYAKITNSNGYNTYTSTDCWGHPGCGYKLESNNPGDFQVTATEPAGNTAVLSYPNAQQLTNNWNPATRNFTGSSDLPRAGMSIVSSYSEDMNETTGTASQAAWDIWTSSGELMIWVDEVGRGSGGAQACDTGVLSGHAFTYYVYGGSGGGCSGGLPIIKLDTNLRAGVIDIGAALDYFTSVGQFTAGGTISQINFGWEVCSTGGIPQTYQMLDYSLTLTTL